MAKVMVVSATVVMDVVAVDLITTTDNLTGIIIVMYEAQIIVVMAITIMTIAMITDAATTIVLILMDIIVTTAATMTVTNAT